MKLIKCIIELANETKSECEIHISESSPWQLLFRPEKMEDLRIAETGLFTASAVLRKHLEKVECKLLCNAGRENIIASRMSKQMGGGRRAYLVEFGKPALRESLVDIFDYADSRLVVSVEKQQSFYKKWVASLGI